MAYKPVGVDENGRFPPRVQAIQDAINGFSIGAVTSLAPGSAPTATLTGPVPGRVLNLGIPKGDTGGYQVAYSAADVDLNSLVAIGVYGVGQGSANLPIAAAGTCAVTPSTFGTIIQTVTTNLGSVYIRRLYTGTWSPWRNYSSTRVDSTAGRVFYTYDPTNNRDQLTSGDTGWRDVSSLLSNGFTGSLAIMRSDRWVSVRGEIGCPVGATSMNGIFASLPGGFGPGSGPWIFYPVRSNANGIWFTLYRQANVLVFEASSVVSDSSRVRFEIVYASTEAWPTTLPGTPIGSIPYQ